MNPPPAGADDAYEPNDVKAQADVPAGPNSPHLGPVAHLRHDYEHAGLGEEQLRAASAGGGLVAAEEPADELADPADGRPRSAISHRASTL